ncbi:MAG: Asp-tRNA(Asn)/Glu-tRNA(Gln) amidotransferase subunit GatC [Candidatus Yanofskybacteria bacterium]|nr:Asp-tRNA(Asn)/Glu-tRNA(Gln) amidotransferase subunit GatC [Candidatus Yanofskybacteria bacterium]
MLTDKEVQKIADLARIKLTDQEKEKLPQELSSILDYINQLNEVDTEGIEPLYQTTGLENFFRADEDRKSFPMTEELSELLVGQAPHKEERFVKVKTVLKK